MTALFEQQTLKNTEHSPKIIDNDKILHYALRSIHLAQANSRHNIASEGSIGIAYRVLRELEDSLFIIFTGKSYSLTELGLTELERLGGPFSNWKDRSNFGET